MSKWKVKRDCFKREIWSDNDRALIAQIPNVASISHEGQKANANLIASAPELLEALIAMTNVAQDVDGWECFPSEPIDKSMDVIAKAKGQNSE